MADKIDEDALRFGQMLQSYREGAKVTQQDIVDATGLTKNYVSSYSKIKRPTKQISLLIGLCLFFSTLTE